MDTAMPKPACPCGFPYWAESGPHPYSAQWQREHKAHHLAVFPGLSYHPSIRNLDTMIVDATAQERGCVRQDRFPGGDRKVVVCVQHGALADVGTATASEPWLDHGRDTWSKHVMSEERCETCDRAPREVASTPQWLLDSPHSRGLMHNQHKRLCYDCHTAKTDREIKRFARSVGVQVGKGRQTGTYSFSITENRHWVDGREVRPYND